MTIISSLFFTIPDSVVRLTGQNPSPQEGNAPIPAAGNSDNFSPSTSLAVSVARGVVAQVSYSDFMETQFPILINRLASPHYNERIRATNELKQAVINCPLDNLEDLTQSMARLYLEPEIEVTLKAQNNVALAAVQHSIVSGTMPWQLSSGNGFFIVKGGGCVGPFCTIVESGMVVIVPGGACTPDKLNKRKAGYPTVNPSMFFDPFPVAAMTIQLPTSSLTNS